MELTDKRLLGPSQFGRRHRLLDQLSALVEHRFYHRLHSSVVGADRHLQNAVVGRSIISRPNIIGGAEFVADFPEKPRAHIAAEHGGQKFHRLGSRVAGGKGAEAED